ncbi:MAG: hypothetical protein F9K29_00340 [Hyphomicrobiaceae bacterium]|nr:MAG: hypothetical protein F9K29_00340 [Hyphomicrobiaceae bacterium]
MKSISVRTIGRRRLSAGAALLMLASCIAPVAHALDEQAGEDKNIKACERRLCSMLVQKSPAGDDLKCELTKTWARSTIKSAESAAVKWGFGDARCSVQLNIPRAAIVATMTAADEYTFKVPAHVVSCVVEEGGEARPVKVKLAPKIVFKAGKAEKVWVNLKSVDGPSAVKATLWTAARLEDSIGLFHRPMIKSINRFIQKHCPNTYAQGVASSAKPKTVKPTGPAPAASAPPPAK